MRRISQALIACAAMLAALPATAQAPADWDKVIAAAKQEGTVTFYTGLPGNPSTKKVADAFEAKYGIRVNALEMRATELRERIRAERAGGRPIGDLMHSSINQTRQILNEDGNIEKVPLPPNGNRIRKDLAANWPDHDVQIPTFLLNYGILANAQATDAPKVWADLADPKWKGKILADDFRATGGGNSWFSVTTEKYGRDFHNKLAQNTVAFTRDQREAERRVARGEYSLYLPWLLNYLPSLKGLPIKPVIPQDGVIYLIYTTAILAKAPHPNAARLLEDFMVSEEGQAIYAAEGLLPTMDGKAASKLPPDLAFLADIKLLGASKLELTDQMIATAKEIYK